jgi:hypothetical protein
VEVIEKIIEEVMAGDTTQEVMLTGVTARAHLGNEPVPKCMAEGIAGKLVWDSPEQYRPVAVTDR